MKNFPIPYILRLISIENLVKEMSTAICLLLCVPAHNCSSRALTLLYSKQLILLVETKILMYGRHNIFHNYIFLHHINFCTVLRDYRISVERPERKAPVGRPRRKWEANINP